MGAMTARVFLLTIFIISLSAPSIGAQGGSADSRGRRLLSAATIGDWKLARRLLKAGVPHASRDQVAGSEGETALHKAAFAGNINVIKALLVAGAQVDARDKRGETPLLQACYGKQREAARLLLVRGADVRGASEKGLFPLQVAAFRGDIPMANLLRSSGAVLGQADKQGRVPLMTAAQRHPGMVKWLLAAGADVNAKTKTGTTALMVAAMAGRLDIVRLLMAAGADVNARRRKGTDVGYYAIAQHYTNDENRLAVLKELYARGARPRDPDLWVRTAIRVESVSVMRWLLSKGFSARKADLYGAPEKSALSRGADMRALLRRHGAPIPPEPKKLPVKAYRPYDFQAALREVRAGKQKASAVLDRILHPRSFAGGAYERERRGRVVLELIRIMRRGGEKVSPRHRDLLWNEAISGHRLPRELPFKIKLPAPRKVSGICNLKREPSVLRRLIKLGLDVNAGHPKSSLLREAVYCDSAVMTRILLNAGVRKDVKGWHGQPLIRRARSEAMLSLLIESGFKVPGDALCRILYSHWDWPRRISMVPLLLMHNADPACRIYGGDKLVVVAARHGYEPLVTMLSGAGARDPLVTLYRLIREDEIAAKRLLESGRVEVDRYAVEIALHNKRRTLYPLLADLYADPRVPLTFILAGSNSGLNTTGLVRRHQAGVFMGMLLERGVNVNAVHGKERNTALIMAAVSADTAMMEILLRGGADVNARSEYGKSALFRSRTFASAELLLRRGARVDYRDRWGNTVLHTMVHRDPALVRLLIKYGADPRARDRFGRTPIDRARRSRKWDALRAMGIPDTRPNQPRRVIKREEKKTIIETRRVLRPLIDVRKVPDSRPLRSRGPLNPANPTPR